MMTHPSSPAALPVVPPLPAGNDSSAAAEPEGADHFDRLLLGAQQNATTPPKPTTAGPLTSKDRPLPSQTGQAAVSSPEAERAALAEQIAQWLVQWLAQHQTGQQLATNGKSAAAVENSATAVAASGTVSDGGAAPGNLAGLPAALVTTLNQIAAHSDEISRFDQKVAALLAQGKASELTQALSRLARNDRTNGLDQALTALTAEATAKDQPALPEAIAKWLQPLGVQKVAFRGESAAGNTQQAAWQKLLAEWSDRRPVDAAAVTTPPLAHEAPTAPNAKAPLVGNLLRIPIDGAAQSGKSEPLPAAVALSHTNSDGRLAPATAHPSEEPLTALNGTNHGGQAALLLQGAAATSRPPVETIQTPVTQTAQWTAETAERIVWHAGRAHEKVELQLTPPHLGKVEVTLQLANDQLTAQFVAASQATRDVLDQAMPRLRELLQQAGIELGQTFVGNQGPGGERQPPQPQQDSLAAWFDEREAAPAVSAAENPGAERRTAHDGLEAWA